MRYKNENETLPSPCVEYWLQGDGSAYIDTGLYITNNYVLDFKASLPEYDAWRLICGAYNNNSLFGLPTFGVYQCLNNNGIGFNYWNYGGGRSYDDSLIPYTADEPFTLKCYIGTGVFYFNGTEYDGQGNNADVTLSTTTFKIFWAKIQENDPGTKGKIYYFKIYDGDTLIRNYVPYKDGDTIGMKDLVNDVVYTNAGGGSFTYGEDA